MLSTRTATPADESAAIALWQRCDLVAPYNDPVHDFRFALARPASDVLVAMDEAGTVVGTTMVGHDGHRGWLYYVAADPEHQGTGIGSTLVRAAEAWLAARGVRKAQLLVRETNAAVVSFYEHLGYRTAPTLVMNRWLDGTTQPPPAA